MKDKKMLKIISKFDQKLYYNPQVHKYVLTFENSSQTHSTEVLHVRFSKPLPLIHCHLYV